MIKAHSEYWLESTSINWSSSFTCFFLSPSFSELLSSSRSREFIWLIYQRQEVSLGKQQFLTWSASPPINHWIPRELKSKNQEYLDICYKSCLTADAQSPGSSFRHRFGRGKEHKTQSRMRKFQLILWTSERWKSVPWLVCSPPKLTFLFADDSSFCSCSHSLFRLSFSCSMALTIPDWLWCFWCFRERIVDSSCRIWGDQRWTNVKRCSR